jgi:hypothetical protein
MARVQLALSAATGDVDELLVEWEGEEQMLLDSVIAKYGIKYQSAAKPNSKRRKPTAMNSTWPSAESAGSAVSQKKIFRVKIVATSRGDTSTSSAGEHSMLVHSRMHPHAVLCEGLH